MILVFSNTLFDLQTSDWYPINRFRFTDFSKFPNFCNLSSMHIRFSTQTLGWVRSTQYGWCPWVYFSDFISIWAWFSFFALLLPFINIKTAASNSLESSLPPLTLKRLFIWPVDPVDISYMISTKNFTPNYVRGLCLKSWLWSRINQEDFHAVELSLWVNLKLK